MLPIALAGPRNSGKTTYLAALFRRLDGVLADECGYAMTPPPIDYTRAALRRDLPHRRRRTARRHPARRRHPHADRGPAGTHPAAGQAVLRQGRAKALTVVLFDAEGEDFDATRHHLDYFSQNELGHLAAADAVLFAMVDTAAIPGRAVRRGQVLELERPRPPPKSSSRRSPGSCAGRAAAGTTRSTSTPDSSSRKIDLARADPRLDAAPPAATGRLPGERPGRRAHRNLRARLREWEARQTERIIEHAYRD
ncbi:TRAFAC clade GTPase domain-containing protein [Yinghuangia aomiensis]